MERDQLKRETGWSDTLAFGSEDYIDEVKNELDHAARKRKIESTSQGFFLKGQDVVYTQKMNDLSTKNSFIF